VLFRSDAEAIVDRLGEAGLEAPQKIENLPVVQPGSVMTSPLVLGVLAVLFVLVAIPVALYVWLNSGEEPQAVPPLPAAPAKPAVPVAPATAPLSPTPAQTTVPVAPAGAPAVAPETAPPVPDNAVTVTPITPVAPASLPPANLGQSEGGAPAIRSSIKLDFEEDAWIEINEDSGRVLMHRLGTAGSSVTLTGSPPFSFVIGNAAHVRMTYNGRPLDLAPYIDVKVARFNLEQ
jgi:cytoskeleton protein RodZ